MYGGYRDCRGYRGNRDYRLFWLMGASRAVEIKVVCMVYKP